MTIHDKAVLDTSRGHLDNIRNGMIKNLFVEDFHRIAVSNFFPGRRFPNAYVFEEVASLVIDVYEAFDTWLLKGESCTIKPENIEILNRLRHYHTTVIAEKPLSAFNRSEIADLKRVGIQEFFGPGYQPDTHHLHFVIKMITDVYRAYDEWLSTHPKSEVIC